MAYSECIEITKIGTCRSHDRRAIRTVYCKWCVWEVCVAHVNQLECLVTRIVYEEYIPSQLGYIPAVQSRITNATKLFLRYPWSPTTSILLVYGLLHIFLVLYMIQHWMILWIFLFCSNLSIFLALYKLLLHKQMLYPWSKKHVRYMMCSLVYSSKTVQAGFFSKVQSV